MKLLFAILAHFLRFFRGTWVMRMLALRHRAILEELRPLAHKMEREISPPRIAAGEKYNVFEVSGDTLRLNTSDDNAEAAASCVRLRDMLQAMGVTRVELDAQLEEGQIAEAFLLLFRAYPYLKSATPATAEYTGWKGAGIARGMVSDQGFHRFCFVLQFYRESGVFQVTYSYCELPLSLFVQRYVQKHTQYGDHRVLFKAAPRVGLIAFILVLIPTLLYVWLPTVAIVVYCGLGVLTALVAAVTVYALGSIQYTREHHDVMLQRHMDEIAEAYRLLDAEFEIIGTIQRSLLPREVPNVRGLDIATHYETCQRAGGDYYDFFPLRNGCLGVLIADVSGHGSPAAVLMAITHTIAHIVHEESMESKPEAVVAYINRKLARHYEHRGDFVTAIYGIYDPETATFRYASAGHNPPMVAGPNDDTMRRLDKQCGVPLGIMEDAEYESATVPLEGGHTLLLYTDGITEAMNRDHDLFGEERMARALSGVLPAVQQVDALLAEVRRHVGGEPLNDDRTVVLLRGCK